MHLVTISTKGKVPTARLGHSATLINDKSILIFGGADPSQVHNDCYTFDTDSNEWIQNNALAPPTPRYEHTTTLVGKLLYLFGGADQSALFNDLHVLDIEQMKWSTPTVNSTSGPSPRNLHATVYLPTKKKLLVLGGGQQGDCPVDSNAITLYSYDIERVTWETHQPKGGPSGRLGLSASSLDNDSRVFVFGGMDKERVYNDLYILDTDTMQWSKPNTKGGAPSPRTGHSCTTMIIAGRPQLVYCGGMNRVEAFNDIFTFDPASLEWTQIVIRNEEFPPHINHTSTGVNGALFVGGGVNFQHIFGFQELFKFVQ